MKIAFTGAHSVGKTTAMNMLYSTLLDAYGEIQVETLGSSTRDLMEIGWNRDQRGFELACIYERRRWMLELQSKEVSWILSERCAIDETAYMYEKFSEDLRSSDNYLHYDFYSVAKQEAEWEVQNYWDRVYYIPVDDRPIDDDGARPLDKDYQRKIDNNILKSIEKYGKMDLVKKMPTELELWQDYFRKEVEQWKK